MPRHKETFALMAFRPLFDCYHPTISKPNLEDLSYEVSRANDVFTLRSTMLGIQKSNRRSFLKSASVYISCLSFPLSVFAQNQESHNFPRPNPELFQTGDFIWPKKPYTYVPYDSGSKNSLDQDREQWKKEREAFLSKYINHSSGDQVVQQRLELLRNMEYREFLAIYAGAQQLGIPEVYSGGPVYVGHVGIIDIDSNKTPWVVEALKSKGIVCTRYTEWITERADEIIWLGRLKQFDIEQRAKVAVQAKQYLHKPYDFWNLDLNDESGFYCSKLAWLSIYHALGFAVDGDKNPRRVLWFSPKQFLYLPTIERIHDPGSYALK